MSKQRGRAHTTLTETASQVVKVLYTIESIKMIAPGEIMNTRKANSGKRWLTAVYTPAGMELIITGQGTQKIAVHTDACARKIFLQITKHKSLKLFTFKERERLPGI